MGQIVIVGLICSGKTTVGTALAVAWVGRTVTRMRAWWQPPA